MGCCDLENKRRADPSGVRLVFSQMSAGFLKNNFLEKKWEARDLLEKLQVKV